MIPLERYARPWVLALVICALVGAPAHANLIVNGSFETGPDPGDAIQLLAGSTAIDGWVVTRTNIDYCGTRWTAASGARSLGLNGSDAGGIVQTFATLPHAVYTVRFYMTGDPFTTPAIKWMRVVAAGQSGDFSADITGFWAWDPGWNSHLFSFTASSTSTTLEFYSLMSGDAGPALDSVTVDLTSTADVGSRAEAAFALSPLSPNPTRDGSEVEFTLPEETPVRLSILDPAGREVARLAEGVFAPGRHRATWDGRTASGHAAPGVYLVELSAAGRHLVRRLVMLR